MDDPGTINILERVRLSRGNDLLRPFFSELIKKNRKSPIKAVNDESLHFATLYLLKSDIRHLNIYKNLTNRNQTALDMVDEIAKGDDDVSPEYSPCCDYPREVLSWIFQTGCLDDGLTDEYDRVMDVVSILLIKIHNDNSILPMVSDMIFNRNRKGFNNHDLIWAFFESRKPMCIELTANHLYSMDPRDMTLACRILSFIPGIKDDLSLDGNEKYAIFNNWYTENKSFLYYTGESFQQKGYPEFFKVCNEGKYLFRSVSADTGKLMDTLKEEENKLLGIFSKLDYNTKTLLSNYSCKLHNSNLNKWENWIKLPMADQVKLARKKGYDA